MFELGSFVHSRQTFSITNGSLLTLDHLSVQAKVTVNDDFHQKIEHSLKKRLPPSVSIQLLYTSDGVSDSTNDDDDTRLLRSLIPLKFNNGLLVRAGLIFIGFATHQTTGIGMHIHSHLIPTIERESLDLQDPHIAVWNKELLSMIGQITRMIYNRTLSENIHFITGSAASTALLAPFSFQTTSPDSQIGEALLRGFLASKSVLQVPSRISPRHPQLSLVAVFEARLATSASLHEFVELPLVPFELAQTAFFTALKRMGWMTEVNKEMLVEALRKSILMPDALVSLLQWLRKEHPNDKDLFKRIFHYPRRFFLFPSLVASPRQIFVFDSR